MRRHIADFADVVDGHHQLVVVHKLLEGLVFHHFEQGGALANEQSLDGVDGSRHPFQRLSAVDGRLVGIADLGYFCHVAETVEVVQRMEVLYVVEVAHDTI